MWGIYYNELFDSLIGTKQISQDYAIEVQDGLTLFKDNQTNEIIGFNLFKVDQDLLLQEAFNSFNEKVLTFLKTKLKPTFDFQQEVQFVIGYVEEAREIPNTHLHETKVSLGSDKTLEIVCGAKNITQGQYVVVALVGAWMPDGHQIQPGKLYGFNSYGMISSANELALKDHPFNTEGIIELPETYQSHLGEDFFTIYQK